jgi:fructose-1,6-bisphosphatase I
MRTDQLSLASILDRWSGESGDHKRLVAIVYAMAEAGIRLSTAITVAGLDARPTQADEKSTNASGDEQKPLDVYAEKVVIDSLVGLDVAAVCSEESEEPIVMTRGGSYVVAVDPVDGSSNIDVNAPIGTIFAILPALDTEADQTAAFLQSGRHQLAAGMIIYGPSTILVLTLGAGTDVYFLDPRTSYFRLVRKGIELPAESSEYAINASNAQHWGVGIAEYIGDLVSGKAGPRERAFNMRWLASLVAEAYRILTRGGIFLYPADDRAGYEDGRIRLVYEANPIAFLAEQAGGAATNGVESILDLVPTDLHQRVPFIFGSRTKVERVLRYLTDPELQPNSSPLFSSRGLFRDRA